MDGPRSDLAEVKERLAAEVDRRRRLLVDVSHRIHAHPELGYEERFAHDLLTRVLEDEGLDVTRSVRGIATAFEARAGSADGPTVAVVCEYDALPGIGHACGHNIIATAGLGAGLAAAALADEAGGRARIMGPPAHEGRAAHASGAPHEGRNALDAAVLGYVNVAALRQHILPTERIHGIFTRAG